MYRLDNIESIFERLREIFLNIYIGNFYDVGSNEFLEFLYKNSLNCNSKLIFENVKALIERIILILTNYILFSKIKYDSRIFK